MRKDDEELMRQLGRLARERAGTEEDRWEASCRGDVSPVDVLDGAAREDRELAEELFKPLDQGFKASLAEAIQAEVSEAGGTQRQDEPIDEVATWRARRAPARQGRGYGWVAAAAAVVLLLAGGIFWRLPGPAFDFEYEVRVPGVAEQRGEPVEDGPPLWRPDAPLRIELEAVDSVAGEVATVAFARRGAACLPLTVRQESSASGPLVLRVHGGDVAADVEPGDWELILALARPGGLPSADQACEDTPSPRWKIYREPLRVEVAPP